MTIIGGTRFTERSSFFNGQRLFASDLQDVDDFNRQMRWLHNQSLHQPGIGAGFATAGSKGDREVTIQPGYAIDSAGREIVLTDAVVEAVPPVAGDDSGGPVFFDLTVSYPSGALEVAETRGGICAAPPGAVRLRETPVFCWVRLGPAPDYLPSDPILNKAVVRGTQLRLARAQVLNCKLDQPLSLAQRRNARPAAQPYVASGVASKDDLVWRLPDASNGASGFGLQLVASIDTTSAGYRTTPCYSAQVMGSREFTFSDPKGTKAPRLVDGFVMLLAASRTGFDFSVLVPDSLLTNLPPAAGDPDPQSDDFRKDLLKQVTDQWSVDWIGVEG